MANSKNILQVEQGAKNFTTKVTERYFLPLTIVLLAASAASIYLIFGKTYQSFRSGQDSLKVKEAELALSDARRQLVRLQKHAAELESIPAVERERMEIVLPTGPNELETLVQLEAFMNNLNLPLGKFSFAAGSQPSGNVAAKSVSSNQDADFIAAKTLSDAVNISFKANEYESLKKVLAVVQQNLRLLDIESFIYNSTDGSASLKITTRHLP
ncbi:hypothetical protein A3H10_01815 [Candidatus Uhrbacteria bacterium RIFCSPLOWO2_12_FULL_46_10]|uniref:Uncharacterized protein n=1 Tax=Candidatus Uhrbacteria bacterium RIFCSPLOWO2_01_FULL_47_25 TaxID=1802402 RepID=A0A1F7UT23_9BACT|nr:MAG: hypothetical protein UX68_C0001G0053 [Parcubacteria group bacterium GW2011_GWA2_46_9]OGL60741.1 MAG: hypothetical protein A2752_03315 [Candidatus Uhrbacteria bacterium RIFCSPHIGHO2_01_FULL_46_23]OGL69545.1 MAG: hypothetical protein A3D60_00900 [Candidatus Uhrbacteria bacterium RIFCSPHIGHO2_02_FULL_47_29]OGL76007.1 MAG: hypothetical protein A3E96_02120 [Candidatus Uhrbacteria bacterium RIFCSPHIGHO2_12_FULL_46_13]OGL81405.1 MAG: hypothetical protein A2936_00220 [Candidatus Uhrbacteria bac